MKQYDGFRMVEPEDLEAALHWAEALTPEYASNEENVKKVQLIRDVVTTGLTYAMVAAKQMNGLPCFAADQTPAERQAAMAAAAKLARRPGKKARP